jgi:hypothetical protein
VVAVGKGDGLQDVGGQGASFVNAINDAGQSVGYSFTRTGVDAVLWSPSGKATVLQDVGGQDYSDVIAINDAGQSVGNSAGDAVLWLPSGKATVLQDVGGQDYSDVFAINDAGQSVGTSFTETGFDAVLWSPSGKATDLGAVLGSAWSDTKAVRINNSGDIIGSGYYQGSMSSFLLMHVSGASTDDYHATFSDAGSVSAFAVHDRFDLSNPFLSRT